MKNKLHHPREERLSGEVCSSKARNVIEHILIPNMLYFISFLGSCCLASFKSHGIYFRRVSMTINVVPSGRTDFMLAFITFPSDGARNICAIDIHSCTGDHYFIWVKNNVSRRSLISLTYVLVFQRHNLNLNLNFIFNIFSLFFYFK